MQRYTAKPWVEKAAYHVAMKRKYDRAARYPWLAIDPDPAPPQ